MSVLKYRNSASEPWQEVQTINGRDGTDGTDGAIPHVGTVSILAANWTGSGPYTQTVTVIGATVTANSKVDIQPDATVIQQMISDDVFALFIENNSGVLTAYAIGAAITVNVTVQVTVMEVL